MNKKTLLFFDCFQKYTHMDSSQVGDAPPSDQAEATPVRGDTGSQNDEFEDTLEDTMEEEHINPGPTDAEILEAKLKELESYQFPRHVEPEEDGTGKLAYISVCKKLGILFPIDSIVERLDKEAVILDHAGLGDKGSHALAEAIRINSNITDLSLVDNWISPKGAEPLIASLCNSKSVRRLDMSDNRLGVQGSVVDVTAGFLIKSLVTKNSIITELILRNNRLSDKDVEHIADGVNDNVTLQSLDLSYNEIQYRGAQAVARILSHNSELRELNLEWNHFRTAGSFVILNEGLLFNNTIKRFNLAWNGIDDDGGVVLGKIIGENAIEEIIVSHNKIGPRGADAIAKGLKSSTALSVLVLDDNPLRDDGCISIIRALRENGTISRISMLQSGCSKKAIEEVSETLRTRQKLKIIIPESLGPK
jgi:Ran GTPase-activating protein (RanGAP) involved in mRNA processing and transport